MDLAWICSEELGLQGVKPLSGDFAFKEERAATSDAQQVWATLANAVKMQDVDPDCPESFNNGGLVGIDLGCTPQTSTPISTASW